MLTITRRVNESVFIGEDVRLVVLRIDGSQVRLGIDAPKDVKILREELAQAEEVNLSFIDSPFAVIVSRGPYRTVHKADSREEAQSIKEKQEKLGRKAKIYEEPE